MSTYLTELSLTLAGEVRRASILNPQAENPYLTTSIPQDKAIASIIAGLTYCGLHGWDVDQLIKEYREGKK